MAKQKPDKTAELSEKIDQSLETLGNELDAGKSEQLVKYLQVLSRFHRYSFGNVMLIAMQRPDATQVAGFHAWKKLGRSVKKGERGIKILAPVMRKKADDDDDVEDENERRLVAFRTAHVFDVSQTDGDDLPEFARIAGDPGIYIQSVRDQISEAGISLETDFIEGGASGVSRGGAITVQPGLGSAEEFSVLVHEFAHELLHRGERRKETTKRIRETEAEAVAFTVCNGIGLETGSASSDYIQLYNGSNETLLESLHHIRDCAARILGKLLNDNIEEMSERAERPKPPQQRTLF
ncbi:hypothetical protein KOR42_34110 [Thalassoglobus neptunius]|uniref:N-terminal domain-containing protein n=1 Tax=Thalassoglobus neptunius TaxID=1938619 RepID=A0A5C5WLQ5_9PLAN|nr:ArdC family protein [Thalassoglobus neptunius]TWT51724.1 hypothetical protein KOR42_34110 [Thalassoglobus neptunius]